MEQTIRPTVEITIFGVHDQVAWRDPTRPGAPIPGTIFRVYRARRVSPTLAREIGHPQQIEILGPDGKPVMCWAGNRRVVSVFSGLWFRKVPLGSRLN